MPAASQSISRVARGERTRGHGRHSDDASDETASAPEDGKENVVLRIE